MTELKRETLEDVVYYLKLNPHILNRDVKKYSTEEYVDTITQSDDFDRP